MLKDRLAQLREERAENGKAEHGFTLIELLVVVVIIGILIAIAIPLYLNYENGAKNKSAASDTRNAVSAVEQCYADDGAYPGAQTAVTGTVVLCASASVNLSANDKMTYSYDATAKKYTIAVTNSDTGKTYTYDSALGKIS